MTAQNAGTGAPRLVLIDCYSLLFRAFFAGRYLSTSDGTPTGALFGFTNMILTILNQEKPDAIYAAWDAPGKTFRDEKYEAYKAHRPEAASDLVPQFPIARRIVEAFGIPSVETPGYEADDLIGTLARRGAKEGFQVIIITGDSDQLQLVGEGVTVRMTQRGVTETKDYDADAVRERYGIGPERIPDFKALVGDTSDNIPGVPGIGEKTATKLLQEWGSLDDLLAHAADLPPGKVKEALSAGVEQAKLSRELATIHCEVPFEGPLQHYRPTDADRTRVREIFEELEFRSLLRRLPAPSAAPSSATEEGPGERADALKVECAVIGSEQELAAALDEVKAAGAMALRLHADSAAPTRAALKGLAFAAQPDRAYYVRTGETKDEEGTKVGGLFAEEDAKERGEEGFAAPPEAFREVLQSDKIERLGHNVKADAIVLALHGLEPGPFVFDTMLAAYLLAPGRSGYPLMELAEEHLRVRSEAGSDSTSEERLAREAALALALRGPLHERLEREGLHHIMYKIEMPLVPVLAAMERVGVPVDRAWLERLSKEMSEKIEGLARRIYELAGEEFLINSTQQLQRVLFEKLQLPTGKKIKTGFSTRADLLESLAPQYEIARQILDYRELSKLKSTYAEALPKLIHPRTGRIHTSLNQAATATGRLSSSDPNLQNIPVRSEIGREIRKAFIAPKGQVLLSCDYSQIELRVFAHVTKDPELVRAFAADEDIHAATATKLFKVDLAKVTPDMRRKAKTVNFAVIYGQSDFGLANTLGIPTAEAHEFIASYFALFPGVRDYTEKTLEEAREKGYVQTLLGRRRYLPEIQSGNFNIRQAAERAAVNMPIQGTAADIMKLAMLDVFQYLQKMCYNCVLLLQVHDELVFGLEESLLPEVTPEIVRLMENAFRMDVRLRVDAKRGKNWAEMAPVKI
jgi:DNA polymerase-1